MTWGGPCKLTLKGQSRLRGARMPGIGKYGRFVEDGVRLRFRRGVSVLVGESVTVTLG